MTYDVSETGYESEHVGDVMVELREEPQLELLEERLVRGAELLFDMEQRGDIGGEYDRWLYGWTELLAQYEERRAA